MVVNIVVLRFLFEAEDDLSGARESRGLGDVYKEQHGKGTPPPDAGSRTAART